MEHTVFCNIVRQSKYDSGAATASTVTDSLRMSGDADVITGDEKVVGMFLQTHHNIYM